MLICSMIVFFLSCKSDFCEIKKPKDIKPIDWENYNDVYTVYWNFISDCIIFGDWPSNGSWQLEKTIKIYGLITGYSLHSGSLNFKNQDLDKSVTVSITNEIEKEIYEKLYAPNWPKKCYAKGDLHLKPIETECCIVFPLIIVNSIDDIYFE